MPQKKSNSAKPGAILRFFLAPGARSAWNQGSSIELTHAHRQSHGENVLLGAWYRSLYDSHRQAFSKAVRGRTVELGSGGSRFKQFMPDLVTSDVLQVKGIDQVVDAQKMPFENQSVGNITIINVLHHIPKPLLFFGEVDRVLEKGGRLVLTEPYISPLSFFFYRFLHHEPLMLKSHIFELSPDGDALLDSNQAMPTILVERHHDAIRKAAPGLRLVSVRRHSALSYFLTGGVNYRTPLPFWMWRGLSKIDDLICRFGGRAFGGFFTVVFEKQ
jgi:SAM-dependent methyltransferase